MICLLKMVGFPVLQLVFFARGYTLHFGDVWMSLSHWLVDYEIVGHRPADSNWDYELPFTGAKNPTCSAHLRTVYDQNPINWRFFVFFCKLIDRCQLMGSIYLSVYLSNLI